jgi:DegV family protein with EDD domain
LGYNVYSVPAGQYLIGTNGKLNPAAKLGNVVEYEELFREYADKYDGVVHVNIGSGFSSSYQNACIAASEFDNVIVIDSQNLSTGQGHIVVKAAQLAEECSSLEELKEKVDAYVPRVEASFVLDQLKYMAKGGRCSSATALGANLLNLKPCIEVKGGKMSVVKKYRGNYSKCLSSYVKDRLAERDDLMHDLLFLTYTPVTDENLAAVRSAIKEYGSDFKEVLESDAGCTVSCHCGPGTLGVLFIRK